MTEPTNPPLPAASDLSSPEPTIQELFARDPLELSDRNIDQIIAELRAKRAAYIAGDKTAGNPRKASGAKAAAQASKSSAKGLDLQLSLDDLGL